MSDLAPDASYLRQVERPNGHITDMSQRKWAVLFRTYTEHKLVVTRLNGFMAVESTENRKK